MKKILILYKSSAYKEYYRHNKNFPKHILITNREIKQFKRTHDEHYKTLAKVREILKANGIHFIQSARGRKIDYSHIDFVITVGGDGTFLDAARHIRNQLILGINSDPNWSVGRLCMADNQTLHRVLTAVCEQRFKVLNINRMRFSIIKQSLDLHVLNDVLICHKNPAAMSRYYLTFHGRQEEQRSSGVWVATPAGSTGAIHSAGGTVLPLLSKTMQYKPRELYHSGMVTYRLTGGLWGPKRKLIVRSAMKDGVIYVDGSSIKIPFHFGEKAVFDRSPYPLKVVKA